MTAQTAGQRVRATGYVRYPDGTRTAAGQPMRIVSLQCHDGRCAQCPDTDPDDAPCSGPLYGPLDGYWCEHGCGHKT